MSRSKTIQCKHLPDGMVLYRIQRYQSRPQSRLPFPTEELIAEGWPEGVVYAKWARLDDRGWLEYGVSLRTAWLTDAGQVALVRYLVERVGTERG